VKPVEGSFQNHTLLKVLLHHLWILHIII